MASAHKPTLKWYRGTLPKPVKAAKPKKPPKPKVVIAKTAKPVTTTPRPSYNAQQQSVLDVWKVVQPQIDAATAASLRSSEAGQAAIKGYTESLAKALSGYNPGEIYGRAQQSLAGIDASVRDSLATGGGQLASQLGSALSAINAPAESQAAFAAPQATIGQQSGAAQFGLGSADLEAITKSRAAAENYAAQLPGIAGFQGLQSAKSLELQRQKDLQDTIGQLTAQVPGLVQQRYSEIKKNQAARAEFAYQQKQDKLKAKADAAAAKQDAALAAAAFGLKVNTAKAKTQTDVAKIKATAAQKAADRASRERIAAARIAAQAEARAASAAEKQAAAAAKTKATRAADFYKTKSYAIRDAQAAFGAGATPAQVRATLWANYGATLMGKGWARHRVEQMIENAIKAGRATPKKTGSSKSTGGSSAGTSLVP